MPSVGMRRSTRVIGARVLRSGRRLWTGPHEYVRGVHAENKYPKLLDNSDDGGGDSDDFHRDAHDNGNSASVDVASEPRTEERALDDAMEVQNVDRMRGIVYRRKRKRSELTYTGLTEDERYGKKFVKKQWRTRCIAIESFDSCEDFRVFVRRPRKLAIVVNQPSYECGYWIACLLASVLSYMTRVRIGMRRLSAFMLSKPIFDAYSSCGVLFLQESITAKNPDICIISQSRSLMPLFSVNFSGIPSCFAHMQTSMCLSSARLDSMLVALYEKDEQVTDVDGDEHSPQISSRTDHLGCVSEASISSPGRDASHGAVAATDNNASGRRQLSNPTMGSPKSVLRNLQLRSNRNIQKRSSLRHKRGRKPSAFRAQKATGALASDFLRIRHDGVQFSSGAPTRLLRSSVKRRSSTNGKDLKSSQATQNASAGSCSANLLIIETDKCFRIEGVTVVLELSASKQWVLVAMKGGIKHWTLTAQKVMRPPGSNRFTHAVIWAGDGGWKLEFPKKQDWFVFKELYKECSDRNMQSPAASVIPVPRVQEAFSPVCDQYIPYVRPNSYISVKDDELTRALMKKSANYDMDTDDEEWLGKLNDELYAGRELQESITADSFELIIDSLEKGFHCNPDEHFNGQAANDYCRHLERREVTEAIHKYWVKKRKQKRSALIRVFQLYQPRRCQVIPKSVLRKKRSFKRQASQAGRGKQRPMLQAIVAGQDALEQQNNVQKLQEAKAAACRYEGLAMLKRQRAQMLMENADLATYRACMALKIAEAAENQATEALEMVSSFFLEKLT